MNNIIKHSKATHIFIELSFMQGSLNLIIKDNGIGFESNSQGKVLRGMGMNNMYSRAKALNGFYSIESSSEEGTTITIKIPFDHEYTN